MTSRALHVAHIVCSDGFAGVERYVQETALAMADAGVRVSVVGGGSDTMLPRLIERGIAWLPGSTPRVAVRSAWALDDPDVLDTHMTEADLVGALVGTVRRIPVVSTRHFAAPRGGGAPARAVAAAARGRFAEQIAISRFVAEEIDGRSVVVHNGVRPVSGSSEAAREPFVLVLQRLDREKRTDVALRAWAAAGAPAGWRLVVAGRGKDEAGLRRLADDLDLADTIDFVGFRSDVPSLLARASVLLASAPSEPFGLSVVEAMAHGVPVVAADGGAHRETVGGVPGAMLYASDDPAAAGGMLRALIDDADGRLSYGRDLRERQRSDFQLGRQVEKTLRILENVTRARRGR